MDKKLISATLVKTLSIAAVERLQNIFGYGIMSKNLHSGISIYSINYNTLLGKNKIIASGLLMLPDDMRRPLPIASLHNGTTFLKSEAPSVAIESTYTGFEFFASSGYITVVPDYIGYGISADSVHPYYDAQSSASCVIDLLWAVKEYIMLHGIPTNNKLFMAGYSEGGYITLAALRAWEQLSTAPFQMAAVAAGAGGFDLLTMLAALSTGHTKHIQPAYIAYLIWAYVKTYGWNKPLNYFFNEPYATLIPELFSGNHSKEYINDRLGTDLGRLFHPDFYTNLKGRGEMELKKALYANSLSDWCPQSTLRLYHGLEDEVIPYQNTEYTYQKFLEKGAKYTIYIPLVGTTHHGTLIPMLASAKPWFDSINKG